MTGRIRLPIASRALAIPAAIAAVGILAVIGFEARPFIPYWTAGDPWQHSHLIPDRATAHLQLDLKRMTPATREALNESLPPGLAPQVLVETLPEFAGRYASLSLMPTGGWAAVIDVRDRTLAEEFLQRANDHRLSMTEGKLVFAADAATADLVRDYDQERNSYSLRQSRLYRHAILNRPEPMDNQAGVFFMRWTALSPHLSEEISLLAGCDPDEYITGTFAADPHHRIEATCIAIAGAGQPPPTLPETPLPSNTEFHMQAAFKPEREHIASTVTVAGLPVLARLYLLLENAPAPPQNAPAPFFNDAGLDSWTEGPRALDALLSALDGSITVTILRGRLRATLPHHDSEAVAQFEAGLKYAGIQASGLSYDSTRVQYETALSDPATARSDRPLQAPCPSGPRHVLIRSDLSMLIATSVPEAASVPAAFCYISHRQGPTTKLSLILAVSEPHAEK